MCVRIPLHVLYFEVMYLTFYWAWRHHTSSAVSALFAIWQRAHQTLTCKLVRLPEATPAIGALLFLRTSLLLLTQTAQPCSMQRRREETGYRTE